MSTPTRAEAFALLREYNQTEKMLKHALAVEAAMRHQARKHGEDEEKWGTIGLIHDLDYERFPDQHCQKTLEILTQRGWPEDWVRAVMSHAWGMRTDVEPQTLLEKTLFAVDELTGLVSAVALVRPSKSIAEVQVKSVKKKWKEKAFAAGVDRSVIEKGAAMLGVSVDDLIADVIAGMQEKAAELGLAGVAAG
jgi:putative nucleotidyltransferase with HDIG domain